MGEPSLRLLEGVRIAAFTQYLLGPAAAQYLADLGADVVKVEPPRGAWERTWAGADCYPGGVSAFFLLANRNVRSVALDLKSEAGREAAARLIAASDVVVENFRPGVMDRLGLGWEACRALRPDLVYASATGYGSDSPYRDLPGQDLIIQAVSGLAGATGRAGEDPVPVGAAAVDQHGAALLAMGILAALLHRQRTGEGQRVELPMLAAAIDLATEPLVYRANGAGNDRPREPVASTFHGAPYGIYRTRDRFIALSMSPLAQVSRALGDPPELEPWLDPALAYRERDRIRAALAPLLEDRPSAELLEELRAGGVWCALVNDLGQALEDPAVRFLDPFWEIEHPRAGAVRVVAHPVRYGSGRPELRHAPPEVGEHSEEVLRELGYADGELTELLGEVES